MYGLLRVRNLCSNRGTKEWIRARCKDRDEDKNQEW